MGNKLTNNNKETWAIKCHRNRQYRKYWSLAIRSQLQQIPKDIAFAYLLHYEHVLHSSNVIPNDIKQLIQYYYDNSYYIQYLPMNIEEKCKLQFTTYEMGGSNSGRSAFFRRFTKNEYLDISDADLEVGTELRVQIVKFENILIRWTLEDANRTRSWSFVEYIPPLYYFQRAHGLFFIFSIVDQYSYNYIKSKIDGFKKYNQSNKRISAILVGTKCDLENERVISNEQASKLANDHDMEYIEVSAKDNINVEYAHVLLLKAMMNHISEDNIYIPKTRKPVNNLNGYKTVFGKMKSVFK